MEALLTLNTETGLISSESAKQEACSSLLMACRRTNSVETLWLIEGRARLHLAESFRRTGLNEAADTEFGLARMQLYQAPLPSIMNKAELDIRVAELKSTSQPDPYQRLEKWTLFSDLPEVQEDPRLMSTALDKAANIALEVLQNNSSDQNRKMFWKRQSQSEMMLEQLGDIYFFYMARVTTGHTASTIFDDYGAILQSHGELEDNYPEFDLWLLNSIRERNKFLVYAYLENRLGENDKFNLYKTINKMTEITNRQDKFWLEDGYMLQVNPDHDKISGKSADDGDHETISPTDNIRDAWFSEWTQDLSIGFGKRQRTMRVHLGTNFIGSTDALMATLLRWLKSASTEGELNKADLSRILKFTENADNDVDFYSFLQKVTSEELTIRLYGSEAALVTSAEWQEVFPILSDWLLQKARHDETKRHYLLANLQIKMLARTLDANLEEDRLVEAQRLIDLTAKLCAEAQHFLRSNTVNWRNILCEAKRSVYLKQEPLLLCRDDSPQFREVAELYELSLKDAREQGYVLAEASTSLSIAQHFFFPATQLHPAAVQAFFKALIEADSTFQKLRESWRVLKGWRKVQTLLLASEEEQRLQIAPLAVQVLYQIPNEQRVDTKRDEGLWTMIQVAKSIGLGWLMRTNSLKGADSSYLDSENKPSEFGAITPDYLIHITKDAGGDVVYVDWYNGSSVGRDMSAPIIVNISPGEPPKACVAEITWKEVDSIVDKLMHYDQSDLMGDDSKELLYGLNPLVQPLAGISKPGQVLVFSSIGNLHRIPLHALQIDDEILIRRNPIVYCSSMTVLEVVFQARKAFEEESLASNRQPKASLFGDPPSPLGKKALNSLAKKLSVKAHIGDAFTSSQFTAAVRDPDLNLFHYHGHVTFDETAPLDQGLEFDDRRFKVSEVFDLAPLSNSYHATLLGCGSGMTKTTTSSDVLGLVPAFLYSGASSTVSTLWKFDDKDAALYTKLFYEEFEKVSAEGGGMVDLAKANQRAVLGIMEKRAELYHWAPFVFNGYWMMRVPGREQGKEEGT